MFVSTSPRASGPIWGKKAPYCIGFSPYEVSTSIFTHKRQRVGGDKSNLTTLANNQRSVRCAHVCPADRLFPCAWRTLLSLGWERGKTELRPCYPYVFMPYGR